MHANLRRIIPSFRVSMGLIGGFVVGCGLASTATAQVTVAGGVADTGTVVQGGPDYTISGGEQSGANLFHSFNEFNLAQGESALFTDGAPLVPIENIISRIVGGNASTLNGIITVDSAAYPGANFFFINPAGVIMQEGFSFNGAGGDLHVSTARELAFADGIRWSTDATGANTLSAAAPTAFGFLAGVPSGDIQFQSNAFGQTQTSITSSNGTVGDITFTAENISASGGAHDIEVDGGNDRFSFFGRNLTLAAMGRGTSEFDLASMVPTASATGRFTQSDVDIIYNSVASSSGDLSLYSGNVSLSQTAGRSDGAREPVEFANYTGGDVNITAADISLMNNTGILASSSASSGDNDAGDINIVADNLVIGVSEGELLAGRIQSVGLASGGEINIAISGNFSGSGRGAISSSGNTGSADISLIAGGEVFLSENFAITSTPQEGEVGDIRIDAGSLSLTNDALISAVSSSDYDSGLIDLNVLGLLSMEDSQILASAEGQTVGNAGNIDISAAQFSAVNSNIIASTLGAGTGGTVLFNVTNGIDYDGGEINVDTNGAGDAGAIIVNARSLSMANAAEFNANTVGETASGNAGLIDMNLGLTSFAMNNSALSASTLNGASGNAGTIDVSAGQMTADALSSISANSAGSSSGNAGTINLSTFFGMTSGATILANATDGSMGDGGSIRLGGDGIALTNASLDVGTTGIGNAGSISIFGGGGVFLTDSSLSADTAGRGLGNAGDIGVQSIFSIILDNTDLTASTTNQSSGVGGTIFLGSDEIGLTDSQLRVVSRGDGTSGDAGSIELSSFVLNLDGTTVDASSEAGSAGNAGSILIDSIGTEMQNNSRLFAETGGVGNGGNITVNLGRGFAPGDLVMGNSSVISTSSSGEGDAGDIVINAGSLLMNASGDGPSSGNSEINTGVAAGAMGPANGGDLTVNLTGDLILNEGDLLTANSGAGNGDGGSLSLNVDGAIQILGASSVNSSVGSGRSSTGTGNGGDITFDAGGPITVDGGFITSSSFAGQAGTLRIVSAEEVNLVNNAIIEVAGGGVGDNTLIGPGSAGIIMIQAPALTVDSGAAIRADARGDGAGGDISLALDGLLRLQNSEIDVSTSGSGDAGDISVVASEVSMRNIVFLASSSDGAGGQVDLLANNNIVSDAFTIDVSGGGSGDAGSIGLVALGDIQLCVVPGNCRARANATGSGDAGIISIIADGVHFGAGSLIDASSDQGSGDAGEIVVIGSRISLTDAALSANSGNASAANNAELLAPGTIALIAGDILIQDGSVLSVNNTTSGDGGHILVRGGRVIIGNDSLAPGGSRNLLSAQSSAGSGGLIEIAANDLSLLPFVDLDVGSFAGQPGRIVLDADNIEATSPRSILGDATVIGFESNPSVVVTYNGRIEAPNIENLVQEICATEEGCATADAQTLIEIVNTIAPFGVGVDPLINTAGHVPGGPTIIEINPENEAALLRRSLLEADFLASKEAPLSTIEGCRTLGVPATSLTENAECELGSN